MDIFWQGQTSFKFKGKNATLLIDPPKAAEADIVLLSDGASKDFPETVRVFQGPGEYESKGVVISGFKTNKNTIYHIIIDGLNIVHLSDIGNHKLSEEIAGSIEQTDILLVMAGNESAVSQLEPRLIIPMDGEGLNKFLKEMGAENATPQNKLSITKDKLPEEPTVVVLNISNG